MGDFIHRAIWYLRCKRGIYISRPVERYIVEELEEDLFPYGFGDGSYDSVLHHVWDFVCCVHDGKININIPLEERILERYEILKEEHLDLLSQISRLRRGQTHDDWEDDPPY